MMPCSISIFAIFVLTLLSACGREGESESVETVANRPIIAMTDTQNELPPSPTIPNLQSELLDERNKQTISPIAIFDFKNFTYPLPRGWQNPDGAEITLTNGRIDPVAVDTDIGMEPDEIAERKSRRRIGASHVTTKFLDVTGDGIDEAVVILKVETTGSAIPQLVYIFEWKDASPELIYYFRTGDRADGGLKDLRADKGELIVELYGQDRFLLVETETMKITDDEEQLCCPTFFTRTHYKYNGKHFLLRGKRLTFSVSDPSAPPVENMLEIIEKQKAKK